VAELRSVSVDPEATPGLREQAALRLARLADATDGEGRPVVAAARPASWWGMYDLTGAPAPVVAPQAPVQLSGSQLGAVLSCPRSWFLGRKAHAETPRSAAASFGSVIHVLAQHGAYGTADPAALSEHLESVWDQLQFEAKWLSAVERAEAEAAIERFAAWQDARADQELLGTEVGFRCEIEAGGERVTLTGMADRVERDPDGRVRIVDFKTSRSLPSAADVAQHDQLGVYQLAVSAGAFAEVAGPKARPAGAELVYLRLPDAAGGPRVFQQASLDDVPFPVADSALGRTQSPTWVHERVAEAVRIIRAERFEARVGPGCRYCPFRGSCPAQSAGRQVVA
jgi:RecB family exonuclease